MTLDDKIKDEKLLYGIKREDAIIAVLSSEKIDKYEFLTGEEILPPDQRRMIERVKFAYFPLEKSSEKQTKITEDLKKPKPTAKTENANKKPLKIMEKN